MGDYEEEDAEEDVDADDGVEDCLCLLGSSLTSSESKKTLDGQVDIAA